MRLALLTNIPAPYQIALGNAFWRRLGNDFQLICWETEHDDRAKLKWQTNYAHAWLLTVGSSESKREQALDVLQSADVIVWGYAPEEEIMKRLNDNKLTFRYTERPYKRGRWRLLSPRAMLTLRRIRKLEQPTHHLLAVGPYCASDFRFMRMFRDRMWRWGYFPDVPNLEAAREANPVPVVLWAGRMLDWKQVDLLIKAAKWAREHGAPPFQVKLVGNGTEEQNLRALTTRSGLDDVVSFHPALEYSLMMQEMQRVDIYVLPSSKFEGWGAVVNEAMANGCCVIGSTLAGAVPWLIRDGVNGYHFDGKSAQALGEKLLYCLTHPDERQALGQAARTTIQELWSPELAAERLIQLSRSLLERTAPPPFADGPCSKA